MGVTDLQVASNNESTVPKRSASSFNLGINCYPVLQFSRTFFYSKWLIATKWFQSLKPW